MHLFKYCEEEMDPCVVLVQCVDVFSKAVHISQNEHGNVSSNGCHRRRAAELVRQVLQYGHGTFRDCLKHTTVQARTMFF